MIFKHVSAIIAVEIYCGECLREKWRCIYDIDEESMRITVLFRNASARCLAPTAPIEL
jgi:hypothetical protein